MDLSQLTPRRPYLLRAFYEWLLDNQLTPHLVVDVTLLWRAGSYGICA